MTTLERGRRYDDVLRRFDQWLIPLLHSDGSLKSQELSLNAYMPLPYYAHAAGRPALAIGSLRAAEKQFVHEGAILQHENRKDWLAYTPAWLLIGAALAGELRLCRVLQRFIQGFQDPQSGGFFGSQEDREARAGSIDFDSTCQSCAALCHAGNENAAMRVVTYLKHLVEVQPEPENRFFLVWDTRQGLVTEFDPARATKFAIEWSKPKQHLYKMGLLVRAFALADSVTGNHEYLNLARSLYQDTISRSPELWMNTLAHKMTWAAVTLFDTTQNHAYLEDACRMSDHIATLQHDEGAFRYPEFWPDYDKTTLEQRLNIGAQFASWIALTRTRLKMSGRK